MGEPGYMVRLPTKTNKKKQKENNKTKQKCLTFGDTYVWHKSLVCHTIESNLRTTAPIKPHNCLKILNDAVTALTWVYPHHATVQASTYTYPIPVC